MKRGRMLVVGISGWRRGLPFGEGGFRPAVVRQTTVETPPCVRLANAHSPRDNAFLSRIFHPLKAPSQRPFHDHRRRHPPSSPGNPHPSPNSGPPTGEWSRPWKPSSTTTPAAPTTPSGAASPAGATTSNLRPCRPSPSPWPATWPPGPMAEPPCGWRVVPYRRPMSGRSWSRPAGIRACAPP